MQTTLKNKIMLHGVGLHSGTEISLTLKPAPTDHGLIFVRTDLEGQNTIPAAWNHVVDTRLCTVIANEAGARVGTIEHLMAALRGCNIDNAVLEINGAEVPIMDGSAAPFMEAIEKAGVQTQSAPRRLIKILKPVTCEMEGKTARLSPAPTSSFAGEIAFDHGTIGTQRFETTLLNGHFRHDIAQARTFGFLHEVEYMQANGLARGGSLDNAIVLNDEGVMNPDGLRFEDEFIRHKLLDAIGDTYLAGAPILGLYESAKPGHALNNALLHALFDNPDCWTYVDEDEIEGSALKGPAHDDAEATVGALL